MASAVLQRRYCRPLCIFHYYEVKYNVYKTKSHLSHRLCFCFFEEKFKHTRLRHRPPPRVSWERLQTEADISQVKGKPCWDLM